MTRPHPPSSLQPRAIRAFTLVEVMMASTILLVGIIGMMQAVVVGSEMMATARRQSLAARIIEHEIEKLRAESWATISALPLSATTVTPDASFNAAMATSGATFSMDRTTASVDTDLREVTYTVSWAVRPSGINASRTYTRSYSAYVSKNGLSLRYQRL